MLYRQQNQKTCEQSKNLMMRSYYPHIFSNWEMKIIDLSIHLILILCHFCMACSACSNFTVPFCWLIVVRWCWGWRILRVGFLIVSEIVFGFSPTFQNALFQFIDIISQSLLRKSVESILVWCRTILISQPYYHYLYYCVSTASICLISLFWPGLAPSQSHYSMCLLSIANITVVKPSLNQANYTPSEAQQVQ